jgi:phage terminase large subunit-like protein
VSAPARVMGKYERLAYERHARDLALAYPDGMPTDPRETQHPKGLWFDLEAGERVIQFVEGYCCHFEGEWAGQPLVLEEWQRFVRRCVYGWKRPDGSRRFRISYQEVPRKNGKSTSVAADADYLTFGDNEPGAQVYATATKEDQAKIVWNAGREMVRKSPKLRRFATLRQKSVVCDRLGSSFKPLGSDSFTLDGLNPHGHVCDELHAHKTRGMWDVMITAMGARRQPLTSVITTAGIYEPESIGWIQHEHAIKVLDGVIEDDEFFAIIFCADEDADWTAEATWRTANPNYGVSVKPEYLAAQCRTAQTQPSFQNTFLRLHLNRWTQQRDRWIDIGKWNACDEDCGREGMMAREAALAGASAFGGLDLSTKLDITALVLVFPETWDLVCRFFVPAENVMERVRRDRVPYDAWIRDGWLIETPGNVIDYAFIRAEAKRLAERYNVREWAYDPWNAMETAVELQGAEGFQMVEVRQGYRSLSEASKKFEELVVSSRWRHGGHPVLRWMVSNVAVREDPNGNIAPEKPKLHTGLRIDGVAAAINALSRVIVAPEDQDTGWLLDLEAVS